MEKNVWASLVAQTVKNLPAVQETGVQSLGWEDFLEKGKATHTSILAWRIPYSLSCSEGVYCLQFYKHCHPHFFPISQPKNAAERKLKVEVVHCKILQARILEWVAFPFSRRSSQPRDRTQVFHIAGRFFTS